MNDVLEPRPGLSLRAGRPLPPKPPSPSILEQELQGLSKQVAGLALRIETDAGEAFAENLMALQHSLGSTGVTCASAERV